MCWISPSPFSSVWGAEPIQCSVVSWNGKKMFSLEERQAIPFLLLYLTRLFYSFLCKSVCSNQFPYLVFCFTRLCWGQNNVTHTLKCHCKHAWLQKSLTDSYIFRLLWNWENKCLLTSLVMFYHPPIVIPVHPITWLKEVRIFHDVTSSVIVIQRCDITLYSPLLKLVNTAFDVRCRPK